MIKYLVVCLLLASPPHLFAQPKKAVAVRLHDTLPSFTLSNVLNWPKASLSKNDLAGKLVILDFWTTSCKACIQAFPKMEALQQQFGDAVQVVLVTPAKREAIAQLFGRIKRPVPALPIVYDDSVLSRYFPHFIVPHHVWINPEGRVQYITDGSQTTAENVAAVLRGESRSFVVKQEALDFDRNQSLLTEGDGRGLPYLRFYSLLFRTLDYTWRRFAAVEEDSASATVSLRITNHPLGDLFRIAYSEATYGGRYQNLFTEILAALLILVFAYAVTSRLWDYNGYIMALRQSPLIGSSAVVVGPLVLIAETVITGLLFHPPTRRWGFQSAAILMLLFTVYIGYLLWGVEKRPCACGGLLTNLSWTQHLLFNTSLTLIAATGVYASAGSKRFIAINRGSRKTVTE